MTEKASSPYINHFLQPDTLIPDPSNPQAWNRYSYVANNPVNFNDPSGHYACGDSYDDCGDPNPNNSPPVNINPNIENNGDEDVTSSLGDIFDGSNGLELNSLANNPNPDDCVGLECLHNIHQDDGEIIFPILTADKDPFILEMEAFSAAGDMAQGGAFVALSIYAIIATCTFAGPACLVTLPIFFIMAVVGAQQFANGLQSWRQAKDPSVEPTGREVIDFVFPFLKKKR